MSIYKAAAIATIIGTVIVAAQYFDSAGIDISNQLPGIEEKSNVVLSVELPEYSAERSWLLAMYEAAKSQPYSQSKRDSLIALVKTAIVAKDFNMAVIAASEIPYSREKADALHLVVDAAIKTKESIAYAVVAAKKMPYSADKREALNKTIKAFESFALFEAKTANQKIKRTENTGVLPEKQNQ